MNFAWKLPPIMGVSSENLRLSKRAVETVLLEYEGPKLVVLRDGERRFLGYAVDEIGGATRWLQVPISNLELKALHRGKATLLDVLAKQEITICDIDLAGAVSRVWISPPATLPPDCLPDPEVTLPEFARDPSLIALRFHPRS
jgi:hypothetical protein